MIPRAMKRQGWREWHVPGALALTALAVLLTREAWADIVHVAATDEESSHIFLVPVVAAWMAWVRRSRLRNCRPTGRIIGPLLVSVGWGLSALSATLARPSMWQAGAIMIATGAALT